MYSTGKLFPPPQPCCGIKDRKVAPQKLLEPGDEAVLLREILALTPVQGFHYGGTSFLELVKFQFNNNHD